MLSATQRRSLFVLFCIFATASVGLECYLVVSLIEKQINNFKVISTLLNGGVLALFGHGFWRLISQNFLQSSIIPPERLHRFASERCNIIENALPAPADAYATRKNLVTNTLKFSEESLRGWVPGSHFELCVFVDQNEPLLFAYFDSNQDATARSMKEREQNPRFYVEKEYEVTRLLQRPTSVPRVLSDTHDAKTKYIFTSNEQRKQLRSSVLICLDITTPCALVISSNEKNAFPETDPEVMSFVRYVGEAVRYDLIEDDFLHQIRLLKPDLFTRASIG